MTETASLLSLFFSSFLAATLLPGGSEAVLFAVLKAYPDTLVLALCLATLGNTLGGMVSFYMGWLLPQRQGERIEAGHTQANALQSQQLKHVDKLRRYGTPALLLAWVPLIGDALCLAAGWLRLNYWQAALFMAIGKFARYGVIALL
jgi:membrane protein YqaA with SNARE-associated domain